MIDEKLDALLHQLILQAIAPGKQGQIQAVESLLALAEQLPHTLTKERLDPPLRSYYDDAREFTENSVRKSIANFPATYKLDIDNTKSAVVRKYFVRWYNLILKRDCYDLKRPSKNRPKLVYLDETVGEGETTRGETIVDPRIPEPMTALIQAENQRLLQQLRDYIQQDPDRKLQDCCSQKYPNCNCWEIARRRLLKDPPEKWEDIARQLNVPYGTLTTHWQRRCLPLLKEIWHNIENQREQTP